MNLNPTKNFYHQHIYTHVLCAANENIGNIEQYIKKQMSSLDLDATPRHFKNHKVNDIIASQRYGKFPKHVNIQLF